MKENFSLRATFYLSLSLVGMLLGSLFPTPLSSLCHLAFVLIALCVEKRLFEGQATPRFFPRGCFEAPRLWLLLPAFVFLTLGANLLSARLTAALGGALPTVTPSLSLFLGAVLIAPVTEELLFRGLILKLLTPYGEGMAILFSSLLFALAHGSVFQIPYALTAGLFLAYAAVVSRGIFLPLSFHLLYNLFVFFGNDIPKTPLLLSLGTLALFATVLYLLGEHPRRPAWSKRSSHLSLLPLLLYAAVMLTLAVLNF